MVLAAPPGSGSGLAQPEKEVKAGGLGGTTSTLSIKNYPADLRLRYPDFDLKSGDPDWPYSDVEQASNKNLQNAQRKARIYLQDCWMRYVRALVSLMFILYMRCFAHLCIQHPFCI